MLYSISLQCLIKQLSSVVVCVRFVICFVFVCIVNAKFLSKQNIETFCCEFLLAACVNNVFTLYGVCNCLKCRAVWLRLVLVPEAVKCSGVCVWLRIFVNLLFALCLYVM